MNHPTKLLMLAAMFPIAFNAVGGEPQIVFVNDNDEQKVYEIADINRITFADEGLILTTTEDETIPYESFSKMVFDYEGAYNQSHIEQLAIAKQELQVIASGNSLSIAGIGAEPTDVAIYSTTGQMVVHINGYTDGSNIDISTLPTGIYLVTTCYSSTKFIKK